jgi:hypothetical protein
VLVAEDLFLLLVRKISARDLFRVGGGFFPDATASDKHLSLQNEFVFARFTLHVIDGVALFYISIETENHARSIRNVRSACMSVKTLTPAAAVA